MALTVAARLLAFLSRERTPGREPSGRRQRACVAVGGLVVPVMLTVVVGFHGDGAGGGVSPSSPLEAASTSKAEAEQPVLAEVPSLVHG